MNMPEAVARQDMRYTRLWKPDSSTTIGILTQLSDALFLSPLVIGVYCGLTFSSCTHVRTYLHGDRHDLPAGGNMSYSRPQLTAGLQQLSRELKRSLRCGTRLTPLFCSSTQKLWNCSPYSVAVLSQVRLCTGTLTLGHSVLLR